MYNMYLSQELENETLVLKFPVLPEKIKIQCDIGNKKYNVLALGDVIRAGKRGLKNLTLNSYFPADEEPSTYIKIIEKMIENEKPIRFIINKMNGSKLDEDLNILIIIGNFSHEEEGGEVGDIYYSYKFTEYREHKARVIPGV